MKKAFDSFQNNNLFKNEDKKLYIISIVKKYTQIELEKDQISFSGENIFFSIRPNSKYILNQKKEDILFEIRKEYPYFLNFL